MDFVPVVGTIKSAVETQEVIDYLGIAASFILGECTASGILKSAEKALAQGNIGEVSKLINKASSEISGHLPKHGNISLPSSGVDSNTVFKVSNSQLGKN